MTAPNMEDATMTDVNVKDFGAVGDGKTDNSAAVRAALDARPSGGTVTFPNGPYYIAAADPSAAESLRLAAAIAEVPQGEPFTMLMCVEGLETSDGRMFELGSTTWRDTPIPFMVQDTSPHGPGQTPAPAWAAGQIETIFRDPEDASRIIGEGHLMANDAGVRAGEIIRGAFRGVSVDAYGDSPVGPDVQPKVVDQDGELLDVLVRYADSVISRVTLVPTPAFAECCVWLADETMPQCAADAHGMLIDPEAEPEVLHVPANAYELLVASGGGPLNPPREGFFTPEADHRQEIILEADGHITGHLFGQGQCHIANSVSCDMAPPSRTTPPFLGFHRTEAHCQDGSKVACGWIPVNTNHSKISNGRREAERWSQDQTWEHYENSGTLVAKVRASNGSHGVWLSGYLMPGLEDRELAIAQGLSVSGHWNMFTDPRDGHKYPDELLAVLGGVPFPGYPETRVRPELLVASGQVVAHIGGFDCGCTECEDEEMGMSAEDKARIASLERAVNALMMVAPDDVRAAAQRDTITETLVLDVSEANALIASALAERAAPVVDGVETVTFMRGNEVMLATRLEGSTGDWTITAAATALPSDDAFDASVPLSASERARWFTKHTDDERAEMKATGAALRDGTCAIADEDDLKFAIRSWSGDPRTARHIVANASRLDCDVLVPEALRNVK